MTHDPAARTAGIAIVGMACRLPGARNYNEFWRNLCAGTESIRFFTDEELLAAGTPAAALRLPEYVRAAALLDDVDLFDAGFFGYSPREAALIDPQQRLFLEAAWEAFEDAGYDPATVDGDVGVFAGGGGVVTSYMMAHHAHDAFPGQTGGIEHISNDKDFLSTRVSYKLDLTGPSITVQTACSTSLVALHLACQSIRAGECDMALAGASTVRIPHRSGYLAPRGGIYSLDGRCRAFDANGTGTIFGSGVAAVLLKPLSDAIADGDHVHAVIRSSAVNNDGGGKVSYTAPSVVGEARAMAEALSLADVPADSIRFVECHATGTTVGDPLEIQALTRAFRTRTRRVAFCAVGSAKVNIGHAEQAAGMAGLIKTALVLEHGVIPPTRVETPNPAIPFDGSPFFLNRELSSWPTETGEPRRAAVNSLGIGGTNAFAVLEQAPTRDDVSAAKRSVHLLCLSAKSDDALRARAAQFAELLSTAAEGDVASVCHTANASRSGFPHRLAIAGNVETLRSKLAAFASGGEGRGITSARAQPGPIAFLFSGQGFQYAGMGRALYETQPTFRVALDRCAALARGHCERDLLEVMLASSESDGRLQQTMYTQPALFALEYSLAQMWSSWGIAPAAVMGHSVGEIAACCAAGVYDVEQAMGLVVKRAALMQALAEPGAMLAVLAGEAATRAAIGDIAGLAIAAVNGPAHTVVSGGASAIECAGDRLASQQMASKRLDVSHAFHSALMDPMLGALDDAASGFAGRPPTIPVVTNRTGALLEGAPGPTHWSEHARGTVRFGDGMTTLANLGHTTFLEVGPGVGLLSLGRTSVPGAGTWIPSLDPKRDDWAVILEAVRQLYLAGHAIRWDEVDRGFDRRRLPLPTYPFQRKRYWLSDEPLAQRVAGATGEAPSSPSATFERVFEPTDEQRASLREHRIHGEVVFPTALIITEALAEGRARLGGDVEIEDLTYHRALVLGHQRDRGVKLAFEQTDDNKLAFRLLAQHGHGAWQQHAAGVVGPAATHGVDAAIAPRVSATEQCPRHVTAEGLYVSLKNAGLDYGPSLRAVTELRALETEAWSRVVPRDNAPRPLQELPFLLDACLHAYPLLAGDCLSATGDGSPAADAYLPIGFERVRVHGRGPSGAVQVHTRVRPGVETRPLTMDISVHDEAGVPVATLEGLSLARVPPEALHREGELLLRQWLYCLEWRKSPHLPAPPAQSRGAWLILADRGGVAGRIAEELERHGARCRLVPRRDDLADVAKELRALAAEGHVSIRGVINTWPLDAPSMNEMTPDCLASAESLALNSTLCALKVLVSDEAWAGVRLWSVTRAAVAAGGTPQAVDAVQAAVHGLGRTLALEHPRAWGGVIDLPPHGDYTEHFALEVLHSTADREVAIREDGRYAPSLARWSSEPEAAPRPLRADGTVLVTGGLGMIGRETSRWLVERHGARNLLITGRSGAGRDGARFVEELRSRDVRVTVLQADVSNPDDVARVFAHIDREGLPLRGIVHCAGVLADGISSQIDWKEFARGLAPKVHGSWLLHHQSESRDLDLFLVHSSILSWTGSVGQGNYTAGNAFLDALIDHRRERGLPGAAINWGPWADAGMATQSGEKGEEIWRRLGVEYIERETGVRALALLAESGTAHGGVTLTDWQRFVAAQPASAPLVRELATRHATAGAPAGLARTEDWATRIHAATGDARRAVLAQALCAEAALELGFDEPIVSDQPLSELGLDSLISVNLANRIERSLGLIVPLVHLVRGPSVDELVARLTADAAGQGSTDSSRAAMEMPDADASTFRTSPANGANGNGAGRPRGARSPGRWLVVPEPRPEARVRLFCFPYAGAGAPVFQPWASSLDHSIELVAVEPPGRAGRIDEAPVVSMGAFMDELMPDLERYLDKPLALFGHCQGAMNLYEVTRALIRRGVEPAHLFVSGARPPHHLFETGLFEETLAEDLLAFNGYDPLLALSEQPEEVFSAALRHFHIGATETFLTNPELRALVLPAVRADFEALASYAVVRDAPWNIPITCLVGLSDTYVSRRNAIAWSEYTRAMFTVHFLDSTHYMVVEERDAIIAVINRDLLFGGAAPAGAATKTHRPV